MRGETEVLDIEVRGVEERMQGNMQCSYLAAEQIAIPQKLLFCRM